MNALSLPTLPPGERVSPHILVDQWTHQWRGAMLRFARLHLSSRDDAEDAVQDALTAALMADPATLGTVDPRAYLFGILRHKVMDRLRHRYRSEVPSGHVTDDLDDLIFNERGHWLGGMAPTHWSTPEEHVESHQFFRVVDICINNLPAKPARIFSMKEFLECDADEICETLAITRADYWQSLSRARKQIHLCLNERWFGGSTLP